MEIDILKTKLIDEAESLARSIKRLDPFFIDIMGNKIHRTAFIGDRVIMGKNNYIGPNCLIVGDTIIGDDNRLEAFCSIGTSAEHRDYFLKPGKVLIGNNNIIREFCTVNAGTENTTTMGNDCVMLRHSHLSHDSVLEDQVTISCDVLIGGESHIMKGANLALGSVLHQRSVVGSCSMLGMNATLTKTGRMLPGDVWTGTPARYLKKNVVGMNRNNITDSFLISEVERYNKLWQEKRK